MYTGIHHNNSQLFISDHKADETDRDNDDDDDADDDKLAISDPTLTDCQL